MADRKGFERVLNEAPLKALDSQGKVVDIGVGGVKGDAIKVIEEYNHLLREVVIQLKINHAILNEVHDLYVNEQDIT